MKRYTEKTVLVILLQFFLLNIANKKLSLNVMVAVSPHAEKHFFIKSL